MILMIYSILEEKVISLFITLKVFNKLIIQNILNQHR